MEVVVDSASRAAQQTVVRDLLNELDLHGPGEAAHGERVSVYAVATGERLGLSDDELLNLRYAAALHDVGKIRIDRSLLSKLGSLTDEEFEEMRRHAAEAESVLQSHEFLVSTLPIIHGHHERFDGAGYPLGVSGAEIPLGARIVAVAETFDVLLNAPGWKTSMDEDDARDEIQRAAGTQFDPAVVEAFLAVQPLIQPLTY